MKAAFSNGGQRAAPSAGPPTLQVRHLKPTNLRPPTSTLSPSPRVVRRNETPSRITPQEPVPRLAYLRKQPPEQHTPAFIVRSMRNTLGSKSPIVRIASNTPILSQNTVRKPNFVPKSISDAVAQTVKVFNDAKVTKKDRAHTLWSLSQWCEAMPLRSAQLLTSFHAHCRTLNILKSMSKNVLDLIAVPLAQLIGSAKSSPESESILSETDAQIARALIRILNGLFASCDGEQPERTLWMIHIWMIGLHDSISSIPAVSDFPNLLIACDNYKEHFDNTLKWSLSNSGEPYAQILFYIMTVKRSNLNSQNISNFGKNLYLSTEVDSENSFGTLLERLEHSLKFYIHPDCDRDTAVPKFLERWRQIFAPEVVSIVNSLSSSKTSLTSCDSTYASLTSSTIPADDCAVKSEVHSLPSLPPPQQPANVDSISKMSISTQTPSQGYQLEPLTSSAHKALNSSQIFESNLTNMVNSLSFSRTSLSSCDSAYATLTSSASSTNDCVVKPQVQSLPSLPPPPPPLPPASFSSFQQAAPPPPPPPPPPGSHSGPPTSFAKNPSDCSQIPFPIPPPPIQTLTHLLPAKSNKKMRTLNWKKLSTQRVLKDTESNIWQSITNKLSSEHEPTGDKVDGPLVDFDELEELFAAPLSLFNGTSNKERRASDAGWMVDKESNINVSLCDDSTYGQGSVTFLTAQRSLSLNVFLRSQKEDIITLIDDCQLKPESSFGLDSLQTFRGLLPTEEEVPEIRKFVQKHKDSNFDRLPSAERFLCNLLKNVDNYQYKIDFMLLREEFSSNVPKFDNNIEVVRKAAQEIMNGTKIRNILGLILISGNFLNYDVSYARDAFGFELSSLTKLRDVRSNQADLTLLHYIVSQAEKRKIADFAEELPNLESASKISIESLQADIRTLHTKILSLNEHSWGNNLKVVSFLESAQKKSTKLNTSIENELEKLRQKIAQYFCEDARLFKLEECFQTLAMFVHQFRAASDENRRKDEQKRKNEDKRMTRSLDVSISPLQRSASCRGPSTKNRMQNGSSADDAFLRALTSTENSHPELLPITGGNISGTNLRRTNSQKYKRINIIDESESRDLHNGENLFRRNSRERRSLDSYRPQKENNVTITLDDGDSFKKPSIFTSILSNNTNEELKERMKYRLPAFEVNDFEKTNSPFARPATLSMNSENSSLNRQIVTPFTKSDKETLPESERPLEEEKRKCSQGLLNKFLISTPFLRRKSSICEGGKNASILSPIDEICASKQFSSRL